MVCGIRRGMWCVAYGVTCGVWHLAWHVGETFDVAFDLACGVWYLAWNVVWHLTWHMA